MRIPAPEIETLVSTKLAGLFHDPIALMEKVVRIPNDREYMAPREEPRFRPAFRKK